MLDGEALGRHVLRGGEEAAQLAQVQILFVLKVGLLIGEHGEVNSIKEVNLISFNVSVLTSPVILQAFGLSVMNIIITSLGIGRILRGYTEPRMPRHSAGEGMGG